MASAVVGRSARGDTAGVLNAIAPSRVLSIATRCHLAFLLLAIGLPALGQSAAAQQAPQATAGRRLQVLFLGAPTSNGPHHDPITRYATLKKGLGVDGIDLTYSEDLATALSASTLAGFDAVLLYGNWNQQGIMPEAQLSALLAY